MRKRAELVAVLAAALAALPLVSGCVYHHRWDRPGATAADVYQDSRTCHHEIDLCWSFCWGEACGAQERHSRDAMARCLRARGWEDKGVVGLTGGSDEEYAGR